MLAAAAGPGPAFVVPTAAARQGPEQAVAHATAVLPHYDAFGQRWVESAQRELPDVTLLGIDERSAAVWSDGHWRAAGPGAVTVIQGAETSRFTSGMEITGLAIPARMLP